MATIHKPNSISQYMQTTKTFPLLDAFRVACAMDNVTINKKARDFGITPATLHYVLRGKTKSRPTLDKVVGFIRQVDEALIDRYDVNVEALEA